VAAQERVLGIISDTHGLLRAEAERALAGSELILHAGDVGSFEVLERLRRIAPVVAVRGNVDRGAWAEQLPQTEVVEFAGALLYLLHQPEHLDLDPAAAEFRAVVFGHTHRPLIEEQNGVLYVNPGSAGPRRFALPVSVAQLRISAGALCASITELSV